MRERGVRPPPLPAAPTHTQRDPTLACSSPPCSSAASHPGPLPGRPRLPGRRLYCWRAPATSMHKVQSVARAFAGQACVFVVVLSPGFQRSVHTCSNSNISAIAMEHISLGLLSLHDRLEALSLAGCTVNIGGLFGGGALAPLARPPSAPARRRTSSPSPSAIGIAIRPLYATHPPPPLLVLSPVPIQPLTFWRLALSRTPACES